MWYYVQNGFYQIDMVFNERLGKCTSHIEWCGQIYVACHKHNFVCKCVRMGGWKTNTVESKLAFREIIIILLTWCVYGLCAHSDNCISRSLISRHFPSFAVISTYVISIHRLALGNLAIQIDTEMAGDDYIKRFDEIGYITF